MEMVMSNKADLRKLSQFQAQGQDMPLSWPRFRIYTPGSGDGIMLTSLSQFQAQSWEIRLCRIRFT